MGTENMTHEVVDGKIAPTNLRALLEQRASAAPAKLFLFSEADGRQFTYAEFNAAVERMVNVLAGHGVTKGDVVSLLLPNSAEYLIAYFACWKLGAIAGPVNSLLKTEEMAYVMGNSEAKALVYNSEFVGRMREVSLMVDTLEGIIELDNELVTSSTYVAFAEDLDRARNVPLGGDDEAIIIYTSGTTGKPKGCLLTHGNLIANARQISQWLGFTEQDRLLTVMPL